MGEFFISTQYTISRSASRTAAKSARAQAILAALSGAGFDANLSTAILQEMWEKWAFIATGAGITCLMRAAFGDIVAAGAVKLTTGLYDECRAIAAANGFPPSKATIERSLSMFTAPGSTISASMLATSNVARRSRPIMSSAIC